MADDSLMEKWAKQNANMILKLNTAVEHFMTSTNAAPRVARRFTYAVRGMYSAINKLNVITLSVGKTIEKLGRSGGFVGRIFGSKKQMKEKISFMERLNRYGKFVGEGKTSKEQFARVMSGSKERRLKARDRQNMLKGILGVRKDLTYGGQFGHAATPEQMASLFGNLRAGPFQGIKIRQKDLDGFLKTNWKRIRCLFKGLKTFITLGTKFMFQMFFIMAKVGAAALLFAFVWPSIKTAIEKVWPTLEKVGGVILAGLNMVWEGLSGIFDFLFGDASIEDFINSIFDIIGGLLTVAVGFIGGALVLLGAFLFKVGQDLWKRFSKYMLGLWHNSRKTFWAVAIGIGVAIVAWLYGFPVLMPALLVGAIYFGVKWLWDKMTSWIPFFAGGGVSKGGLAVVGERGPELVNLSRGSRVHSNRDSRKMVSSGGSTINVTINAHSLQDTELRRIAQKVGDMINRQVNRGTSSSTVR